MVYVAALLIVAGVALYVAAPLIPLRRSTDQEKLESRDLDLDHLMHERALAVQGLRELEFDREMNKLSQADFLALRAPLEARALKAMASIERLRADRRLSAAMDAAREEAEREARPAPAAKPVRRIINRVSFCAQCGTKIRAEASFCVECGASLAPLKRAAAQGQ